MYWGCAWPPPTPSWANSVAWLLDCSVYIIIQFSGSIKPFEHFPCSCTALSLAPEMFLSCESWQGGWTKWPTEVPSKPYRSVVLWVPKNQWRLCLCIHMLVYSLRVCVVSRANPCAGRSCALMVIFERVLSGDMYLCKFVWQFSVLT